MANKQPPAHYLGQKRNQYPLDEEDDEEEENEEDEEGEYRGRDRIRRSFGPSNGNFNHKQRQMSAARQPTTMNGNSQPETIQVTLNEGYFARERRMLIDFGANCRQKLNSMQMFNPAKNETIKQQQEEWNEKEKYTLDSLNEIKGPLDERFQWNQPEDGREVWPSKLQYFLAITSYSIGLGNVIRFPILVQKNGGLAFILPFLVMLLLEGIPLLYLELAIGQRMRKAAISCWNLVSPFAAGIGLASAAVSFVIGLYYNTMVAWTLVYLWASLTKQPLPYTQCPMTSGNFSGSGRGGNNSSVEDDECQSVGPYQFYWYRRTLNITPDANDWSNLNWPIAFCLLAAWLISYFCLIRGLSSSKRIVYIASTFPYVILIIFFFKAISLKGWADGVGYLFEPEWSKLVDPYVWLQAAAQVFFSLGLGFGGLIALSSYNQVNNNCYKDAVRVGLVNFCTSMFAGIVIFAILGFKANLGHEKCVQERNEQISFYLADYNLKVLDYGAVFKQVPRVDDKLVETLGQKQQQQQAVKQNQDSRIAKPRIEEFIVTQTKATPLEDKQQVREDHETAPTSTASDNSAAAAADDDEYNSEDAIASIINLDRQLDMGSPSGSFDYGDSDTEFILNASALISPEELDKIIENIPNLLECSVKRELDEATQGTGLVFVVMAEALSEFNDNETTTWAIVFFLMILALGFDSQFGNLEGLLSSIMDLPMCVNNINIHRQLITGIICGLSFIMSLVFFAHGAGSYMFTIFDEYAGSFSLVLIALFELLTISYIYGLKRFCDDCELMTGKRPPFIVLLSWRYISPILLLIVTLATIRQFSAELNYEAWSNGLMVSKSWPNWCIVLGSLLIIGCIVWIPLIAVMRAFSVNLLPEEQLSHCWFPAEELREFHDLQDEHMGTKLERILFGFHDED